ncbi:hypothetical protein F0919_14265 [Taibaiella lutea]|uniref:Uncharacterized protein n=1 Tax=Taibaiella lutea TaxID=2608001 RepID=A0A5M6CF71_9BACT|nr:hypothetical protein [Taibaiella lutea]KAA5533697.1 hypothetical protein F0919_14265 [Taibaiella lutea]
MQPPLPKGLIDKETAKAMEKLYVDNQYAIINRYRQSHGDDEPDSRETIFSLEEIENYIAYVKEASNALGLRDLGIRIYQGAKSADEKVFTTVFFAPTNEGNNSMEIQCLNLGSYGRPPTVYDNGNK